MEYILVMALSGTTMTLLYLAAHRILKEKFSARAYYLLARAAVIYYLIPLPYLKKWYKDALQFLLPEDMRRASQIPLTVTNYAVHAEGKLYANIFAWIQAAAVIVWVAGACFVIVKRLTEYVRTARRFAVYADREMADRHREIIDDFRAKFGVKRRVALYYEKENGRTMTFGVIRPVIVCGREPDSRAAELLLRHEMVHIKRLDVLWKVLLQFASFIHWWNPLLWRLDRSFERDCECSCDEAVMAGRPQEEVTRYLKLLVAEAKGEKETKEAPAQLSTGFGEEAQKLMERVENLKMRKKWNRWAAGALVATLIFANSMTVFAYRDVAHVTIAEPVSQEEIKRTLFVENAEFVADKAAGETTAGFKVSDKEVELQEIELLYEKQFVDEAGNIYEIDDEGIEPQHSHNLVWGNYYEHTKNSSGGCEVRTYRAQMCNTCTYIIRHELLSTTNYTTCPH
ncbi:MAG: M56 family metallopeptidase [Bacteroidales bacterium]|nr:M56 family metallopeptidase [Bacteroidales bacterium]MCM1415274.1 M56 family metallopeptidase [bacterium]MCM1424440.1 M56 family metallopeptidase [bacterium]